MLIAPRLGVYYFLSLTLSICLSVTVKLQIAFSFLPCDALRCRVFVIVFLSVCLSVRPSVTLVDCVHMV